MTVGELIETLSTLDKERIVVLSKDGEGNSFSPLDGFTDDMVYVPDSTWSGSVMYEELTDELRECGYTEEDIYGYTDDEYDEEGDEEYEDGPPAQPCVVFWPTN